MKHIAQNFKGHYKEIILGPLFKLFEAVLELLVPLVMANIIDIGIRNNDLPYILRGGIILLVLAVLGVVAAMVCQYYAAVAGGHFGRNLRNQLYRHVMTLSNAETEPFGAGGLTTRLTNDANQIQQGVNMAIRLGSRVPFLAVGSIVMAMVMNFKIGLIFLLSTPLVALVLYFIMKRTLPRYGEIQHGQDTLSRLAGENLDGVRVIRAFSRQKAEKATFDDAAESLSRITMRVGRISAVLNPLTTVIVNLAIMAIVWLGARFAFSGQAAPGEIIALVNYMNQTLLALIVAANVIVLFTRAIASTKRVAAVLDTQPAITDGPGAQPVPAAAAIAFENACFAYHEGAEDALEDVSFAVRPGQTVGVIGGTGSGKSTLVNLLVRYYDVRSGSVRIAGNDVRDYTLHELRSQLGLVPQGASLFSGSVRRNLAIGKQDATDDEMWRALRIAQGEEFVRAMPGGLDAVIEEGGKNLSGGQKQRLTIARALVRRPRVLILDDASSALDYATDAALRTALRRETGGMTTVMVSQRAASIQHADLILVLDDGRLVGSGTHAELVESNTVYREICISQGLIGGEVSGA